MSSEAVEEDSTASIDHPWCEQHKETIRNVSGRAAYTLTEFLDSYIANPQNVGDDPLLLKSKHDFLILPSPEMLPFSTASIRNQQSLDSLVDDVVWELVQKRNKSSQTPDNVLCQGFILSEFCQNHHRSHFPMTVQHLNPAVDYCKNNFSDLHRAIGDDILRQMLLHTSLFLPLQNGNLWQITGVPIDRMDSKNKRKRGGLEATCTWTRAKRRTLVYSNGFTPKVGLGNDHILTKTTDPEQIIFSIYEYQLKNPI